MRSRVPRCGRCGARGAADSRGQLHGRLSPAVRPCRGLAASARRRSRPDTADSATAVSSRPMAATAPPLRPSRRCGSGPPGRCRRACVTLPAATRTRRCLPPMGPALARIDAAHKLYGGPALLPQLAEIARAGFAADGVTRRYCRRQRRPRRDRAGAPGRAAARRPGRGRGPRLATHRRPGDRHRPAARAGRGRPGRPGPGRARSGPAGRRARLIVTPRGQNPTGAVVDARRAAQLRAVLAAHPQVLVVEDDYLAAIAGVPYTAIHGSSDRWAVVRSVSKVLGPDLRLATLAADPLTVSRIAGRQLLGPGWVSHLLQQTAAAMCSGAATRGLLARAGDRYAARRAALVAALAERGIGSHGRSGLGVWIPVDEEAAIVQALAERGWAVGAGERFRYRTPRASVSPPRRCSRTRPFAWPMTSPPPSAAGPPHTPGSPASRAGGAGLDESSDSRWPARQASGRIRACPFALLSRGACGECGPGGRGPWR